MRLRIILFLLFLCFSQYSMATDYYWRGSSPSGDPCVGITGSSASSVASACVAALQASSDSQGSTNSYSFGTLTRSSDSLYYFRPKICGSNGSCYLGGNRGISRQGTSCPEGYTYEPSDPNGDQCKPPPQTCQQTWSGGEIVWSQAQQACVKYPNLTGEEVCQYGASKGWTSSSLTTTYSNSPNGPSQSVDQNTYCVMDVTAADCTSRVNSDGQGSYYCRITAKFNGQYNPNATNTPDGFCPTGDCEEAPEVPDVPAPEPQAIKDQTNCVYSTQGNKQVCQSSSTEGKEGTSNCGTLNGQWMCVQSGPKLNGIEIWTEVETQTNPDGSTTTTKKDTAKVTTCTDIASCTSKTTTNTTTTTKDGSGNTTSISGSCTGSQCADSNTNPDGDGDGLGDCVGDNCSGGGGAGITTPELDDVPSYGDSLTGYFDAIQAAPIVSAVNGISLPSGGTCPVYSESIEYIGTISTSTFCTLADQLLSPLRLLFLAVWAFAAIRTLMSA